MSTVVFICFRSFTARGGMCVIRSDATMAPAVWPCCRDNLIVLLYMYLSHGLDIMNGFRAPVRVGETQIALLGACLFVTRAIQVQCPLHLNDVVSNSAWKHKLMSTVPPLP